MRRALEGVRDHYQYVIVDCPPSLGLVTLNMLAAADSVLIPIQCEYYALEGLSQLLNTIKLVQRNFRSFTGTSPWPASMIACKSAGAPWWHALHQTHRHSQAS